MVFWGFVVLSATPMLLQCAWGLVCSSWILLSLQETLNVSDPHISLEFLSPLGAWSGEECAEVTLSWAYRYFHLKVSFQLYVSP